MSQNRNEIHEEVVVRTEDPSRKKSKVTVDYLERHAASNFFQIPALDLVGGIVQGKIKMWQKKNLENLEPG